METIGLFIYTIICCFWMPIAFQILLIDSIDKKKLLFGNIFNTVIIVCASIIAVNEISLIIACLAIVMIFLFYFRVKKIQLLYIPAAYIITVLCNYLVEWFYEKVFGTKLTINMTTMESIIQVLLITVFIYIVSFVILLIQRKLQNKSAEIMQNKVFLILLIIDMMLCVIAFLINNWIGRKTGSSNEINTILLLFWIYLVLTVIISLITFKVYNTRQNIIYEKEQYERLKEYTSQIEVMYQSIREFKHDYVNVLNSISGYLEEERYDELKKYFYESILKESKSIISDEFKLNQLTNIKDLGLKGLISSKLIYAHELGIKIVIDILDEIDTFYINSIDLNRIIGIYLDNAIEAALECKDDKEVFFNVVKEENSVAICIMNTFEDKHIPLSKLEQNGFSTKGEGRGIGLYNVKEVLKKYKGVTKSTSIKDGFFLQLLILQK